MGAKTRSETPAETRDERIEKAAARALAEAEERRARRAEAATRAPAPEIGGRDGPEPTRYGDWEKDGIAIDFS